MFKLIFSIVTAATLFAATPTRAVVPDNTALADKVSNCYFAAAGRASTITIQQMHDCSGVWVTPRALLQCLLQMLCPVYSDTLSDRAA
jgi:hypothetical protein